MSVQQPRPQLVFGLTEEFPVTILSHDGRIIMGIKDNGTIHVLGDLVAFSSELESLNLIRSIKETY